MKIRPSIWFWIGFFALLIAVGWANAEETTITWIPPTGSEVCTADPTPADIGEYRIWQLVATITDPAVESWVIDGLYPGDYTWISTSVRTDGLESRISNAVTKTVGDLATKSTTAFSVATTNGKFLILAIGTVPLGIRCDPNQKVNGFNAIPKSDVTFTNPNANPLLVVASCG